MNIFGLIKKLRHEWLMLFGVTLAFYASFFALFHRFWAPIYAMRWLGLASAFGVWQFVFLWRNLHLNCRNGDSDLLPALGWANRVSFLRGIFISALLGFLFSPWAEGWLAWLPFTFYLFATLSDILDGYLARITATKSLNLALCWI